MASRAARTDARNAARAKARREAARLEKLKTQVEFWVGDKLRQSIAANENLLTELTTRLEAKENHSQKEYRKLQESVDSISNGLGKSIQEIAVPIALRTCKMEMEIAHADAHKRLCDQFEVLKHKVEECREGQTTLRETLEGFRNSAGDRLAQLEGSAKEQRDAKATLQKLQVEFQGYVNEEDQRDVFARRLEVIVKDLEERTWPWRTHMDRSGSPHAARTDRSPSPTYGSNAESREPAGYRDITRPNDTNSWRPWPPNGPVKPAAPMTRPSSRPSSARQRRPSSQDPCLALNPKHSRSTNSAASAGSGLAAARVRPPSAREDQRSMPNS